MTKAITEAEFEKAADQIHLEIGRAISEWYGVEQWLHNVFVLSTSPSGSVPNSLSAAFWAIHSFRIKADDGLRRYPQSWLGIRPW